MLHPDTEIQHVDGVVGCGVFATEAMPRGTITWVRDPLDQVLDMDVFRCVAPHVAATLWKHSYYDGRGDRVLCWDLARFMNHSCDANTLSPGLPFDIAIRDIEAGEELTSDYGALNLEEPFSCACRSGRCRGTVHPSDFERFADAWDRSLRSAFFGILRVQQPLWQWVQDKRLIEEAADDPSRIPSILQNRWPDATGAVCPVANRYFRR